jgi:predicted membrane protein
METNDKELRQKSWKNKTVAFGLLVLFAGVALLLRNIGIMPSEYSRIIFSWQMLIIAIGFVNTLGNSRIWGILLMLVGGIFLIAKIYGVSINFWQVAVPTLVILVGVALLFSSFNFFSKRRVLRVSNNDDVIEDVAVFAGSERSIHSESFRGGKILAVFGGSKLNLTKVQLAPEENELEIVCVFGGVSLIVPDDWNIKVEVFNIFGGYEDKRNPSLFNKDKTLVIKGVTVFGGGEVKSY